MEQEGWHYELEEKDQPLTYKGVVFNEMKGVYSSPDSLHSRTCQQVRRVALAMTHAAPSSPSFCSSFPPPGLLSSPNRMPCCFLLEVVQDWSTSG